MQTITVKKSVLGKAVRTLVISDTNYEDRVLRPYQQSIVADHLGQNQCTLTESPTGSGKSTIMLCHAAKCIKNGKKVIIATPQLGINAGFRRYTKDGFSAVAGEETFRLPKGTVIEHTSQKAAGIRRYLRGPSRNILVCSYAALVIALEDEALGSVLANTVVLVDEVHHSNYGENSLGSLNELCLEKCAEIHGFTATAFRTDNGDLFNGEFKHHRRTLKEHYGEGYCPDFGVYVKFYQEVSKEKFEQFEAKQRALGSTKALINAYLDEYEEYPLPTIMLVSTANQAYKLEKAIEKRFGSKRVLNFGSDDGEMLISKDSQKLKKKFKRLNAGEDFDIVIAIRLMNEGIDWPPCAQTFSPRITSSLQLLMQRAIGRSLRLKSEEAYPDHPSRHYSRIILFEIGIKDEDKGLCVGALFELAVRLKALCEGLDFADPFRLRLSRGERRRGQEREEIKHKTNPQLNMEITARLHELAVKGAPAIELAEEYAKFCAEQGVEISPDRALEVLVECKVVSEDSFEILQSVFDDLSKKNAEKLNDRLTFAEFGAIPGVAEALDKIKVIGASDYTQLLSGHPDIDRVMGLLQEHMTSSVEKNKAELLEMARNGEDRPHSRTRLGSSLKSYTYKLGSSYDSAFDESIHQCRPDWFISSKLLNQQELLEIAKKGLPRCKLHRKLAIALVIYTAKSSPSYDSEFDAKIRKLRPDWFKKRKTGKQSKQELLIIAKKGLPRTSLDKVLYAALGRFTYKSSKNYDPEFDAEIRRLRPDWFSKCKIRKTKKQHQQKLLEIAKNGLPRASLDKILAKSLCRYTKKNDRGYDPVFDAKIRKLRPDWFKKLGETYKQELLKMAKKGAPRPPSKNGRLYSALYRYTNKIHKDYDPEFDAAIRELRPDWFKKK